MLAIVAFLPHIGVNDIVVLCLGILMVGAHLYGAIHLKRRLPDALIVRAPLHPLEPGAVRVTYQGTRASAWRCELYTLTHRSQTLLSLGGFPLLWFLLSLTLSVPAPADALARLTLIFLGWSALLGLLLSLGVRQRYPRPDSVRVCTTTLTAAGYEDVTPDKTFSVPWREVTDIRGNDGDVFLWRGARGNIINREAFQDRRQAQEFYAAAVSLWKGRPADWPYAPAPQDNSVWPPPPQLR